jgi:hypothetical protein
VKDRWRVSARLRDVVGLYLDPPERAMVFCVDEKSQIQALNRSQPILSVLPGVRERRSHDCKRNGTTSLFATLDMATGKFIGSLHHRHRSVEFKKFFARVDAEVPADLDMHLICDNYATHKTPAVKRWVGTPPPLPPAFRAHEHIVAQHGTVVRRVDQQEDPPRQPPLGLRART